jgi:hypothetical protein
LWAVAGVLGLALVLVVIDRALAGIWSLPASWALPLFVGGGSWLAWRAANWAGPAEGIVDVALVVEQQSPDLGSLISSGAAFAMQEPEAFSAGSLQLRRATLLRASSQLEGLNLDTFFPYRSVYRAAWGAGAAIAVWLLLAYYAPRAVGVGLARMLDPWTAAGWSIPDAGGQTPGQSAATPGAIQWQLRVQPPRYTSLERSVLDLDQPVEILAGSAVELRGQIDWPARSARLTLPSGRVQTIELPADERTIRFPASEWQVEDSGTIQLAVMADAAGEEASWDRAARRAATVRVVADRPPRVAIVQPTARLAVVPDGVLPVEVAADDDRGVRQVQLELLLPSRGTDWRLGRGVSSHELAESLQEPPRVVAQTDQAPLETPPASRLAEVQFAWEVAFATLGIAPGQTVVLRAVAHDYAGQRTDSEQLLLVDVVSAGQLQQMLGSRLAAALERLRQALTAQRENLRIASGWEAAGAVPLVERAREIRAATLRQYQVDALLVEEPAGLSSQLKRWIAACDRNRSLRVDGYDRVALLVDELSRLAAENLPQAHRALEALAGQPYEGNPQQPGDLEPAVRVDTLVDRIKREQTIVERVLDQALADLQPWELLARLREEVLAMAAQQQRIQQNAHRLAVQSFQPDHERDTTELIAEGTRIAEQQLQQAMELDDWLQRLDQRIAAGHPEQDLVRPRLQAARDVAGQTQVQRTQRQASRNLRSRRWARANQEAEDAVAALRNMARVLAERTADERSGGNTSDAPDTDPARQPKPAGKQDDDARGDPATETSATPPPGTCTGGQCTRPPGQEGQPDSGNPQGTSPGQASGGPSGEALDATLAQRLVQGLWGELPARERQSLLQPLGAEFVPKYAAATRQYFRRLAEPFDRAGLPATEPDTEVGEVPRDEER